jgi:hypothetical protein
MIREPYQLAVGGLLAVQGQNMKLARYSAGVLLERAEKQREAFRSVFEGSFRAYMGLLYYPYLPHATGAVLAVRICQWRTTTR